MRRPFAALLLAGTLACSVPPEQGLVSDFFAASRLRDFTALSQLSTTIFEPRERGTVTRVRIERVSEVRIEGPLALKDVTVDATLHRPDGAMAQVPLVVTLSRPAAESGRDPLYGGWKVTSVK
jgi:hypothetical protein